MAQVPAVNMVTVDPLTVQMPVVELAKVTAENEESVAVPRRKVPVPPTTQVWVPGAVHEMVWGIGRIVTVSEFELKESALAPIVTGPML